MLAVVLPSTSRRTQMLVTHAQIFIFVFIPAKNLPELCFSHVSIALSCASFMMRVRHVQSTPERRVVETGRVCLCNYGKFCGKLVVIVNVIDGRRVLVDGPVKNSGIKRQVLTLTCYHDHT